MIVGIDTWNIRGGGGLSYLYGLLHAVQPHELGIERVIVWGARRILERLPDKPSLTLVHVPMLDGPLPIRLCWAQTQLTRLASESCDVLFVLGGIYLGSFRPFVAMSQNVLPFDLAERRRYNPLSWQQLRLALVEKAQMITFRKAPGVIFVTQTARQIVQSRTKTMPGQIAVIPHGIAERFRLEPRPQQPLEAYSYTKPFRLLYVSVIREFKHQWNVAKAVAKLRRSGMPITIDFVGPADKNALDKLNEVIRRCDPRGEFLFYRGPVPYQEVHNWYHSADAFIFASSCESISHILLEAMASGLPIACSNRGPMPEVLGDAGIYFDPERISDISSALVDLMASPEKRSRLAWLAFRRAGRYSWRRCANETFDFIKRVYSCWRSFNE